MNKQLQGVVTPPYIYHGCSTREKFWEEKCTGEKNLFSALNIKNCGCHNIRTHREIKGCEKYVTLDILLKTDSLEKMKITSSDLNEKIGKIRKGVDYLSGFQGHIN